LFPICAFHVDAHDHPICQLGLSCQKVDSLYVQAMPYICQDKNQNIFPFFALKFRIAPPRLRKVAASGKNAAQRTAALQGPLSQYSQA
jgi:hypothetical protein